MKTTYKLLLLIILNLIFSNSYSQSENLILGTWIKTDLKSNSKDVNEFTNFLKYTFKPSGKFYLSTSPKDLGIESDYNIEGKTLQLKFNTQQILKLDKDSLIIQDSNKKGALTTLYFIKEDAYIKNTLTPNDFFLKDKDTIYFENALLSPTFKNKHYKNDHDFILHHVKHNTKDQEAYSYATFIIDTTNQVSDINILHHISKKYDQDVVEAIKKTNGMWSLPTINGKKVPVLKTWSMLYYKMPNVNGMGSKSNNVTVVTSKAEKFNKRYTLFFIEAVKQYLKTNYKSALNLFQRSENLTSDKLNAKIQIANCYKSLHDNEAYNNIKTIIEKSQLDYVMDK
ncbi:hypothetical protein [Formosa algae]|uniref:hypothetical protein n=1 Tax=Formosa algae TaxID=225843 RepID=UPI000CCE6207|nr:hypothetical protein [Formosa algae]PNW27133.1 hypothetical protein BKP44_14420 [Formosa algae]